VRSYDFLEASLRPVPWMASISHAPFLRGTLVGVPNATQGFKKSSAKFLQRMTACAACCVELSPRSHAMVIFGDRCVTIIDFRLNHVAYLSD
jgi:hypothetical protein